MSSLKSPLAASIVLCETVLAEASGVLSAIRILNTLQLASGSDIGYFHALTMLTSAPGDRDVHVLSVKLVGAGLNFQDRAVVASAPDHPFSYGYRMDPNAPGGFNLTTQFAVDVTPLNLSSAYFVEALLDGVRVAQASIMLRR